MLEIVAERTDDDPFQVPDSALSDSVYNPYPTGILASDLSSEIARVLREVDVIESRALARWHTLH